MTQARPPAQNVFPALSYRDAPAAIRWLEEAFGFERLHVVEGPNGKIVHAELRAGGDVILLGDESGGGDLFGAGTGPAWTYVVVDDPDGHHSRARAAGAEIVQGLRDERYGSRVYAARDPEGNVWSFGTYRPQSES